MRDNCNSSGVIEQKQKLRSEFLAQRQRLTDSEKLKCDAEIVRLIGESELFAACQNLLIYYPVRGEISLLELAKRAIEEGKSVYFPVCCEKTHTMDFCRVGSISDFERFEKGAYGIPEPANKRDTYALYFKKSPFDLCILPGLSADKNGTRLGYGGGYYDRFLASFEGVTLFAVRDGALYDGELPREATDVPCRYIVTTKGICEVRT